MRSDTCDLVPQNILSDESPLFSQLSFTVVLSAIIHYTVFLLWQSFCHALLLKEMEKKKKPSDITEAFLYQQASNSPTKSLPINYKLIVYKHFHTIFQMIINEHDWLQRSERWWDRKKGKEGQRESRLIGFVVFIHASWHWVMDEFQKPQNPKNA